MQYLDRIHPIGKIIETMDSTFDPNVSYGGTWIKDNTGSVVASKSSSSKIFNAATNTVVGSDTAVSDMPSHTHKVTTASVVNANGSGTKTNGNFSGTAQECIRVGGSLDQVGNGTLITQNTGSGTAHNNMMKYRCIARWIRTA